MGKCLIYGLTDPRTGAIRYIGQSSQGMYRPRDHRRPAALSRDKTYKGNWVRALVSAGLNYGIVVLEELADATRLSDAERRWIAYAKDACWPLTNATDGGGGTRGYKRPPEQVAAIVAKVRLAPRTPEWRARMSASAKARGAHPPEVYARAAAKRKGVPFSQERKDKLSVAARERYFNPVEHEHSRQRTLAHYREMAERGERPVFTEAHRCKLRVAQRARRAREAAARSVIAKVVSAIQLELPRITTSEVEMPGAVKKSD